MKIMATIYELVKAELEKSGELMVKMDSGDTFELHKHNTEFDDANEVIKIHGSDETIWLPAGKIEQWWIHRRARD